MSGFVLKNIHVPSCFGNSEPECSAKLTSKLDVLLSAFAIFAIAYCGMNYCLLSVFAIAGVETNNYRSFGRPVHCYNFAPGN